MVAAADAVTNHRPRLLRYWIGRAPFDTDHIRIEWVDSTGTHTTCGRYFEDDNIIRWDYDDAPDEIDDLACDCARDAGECLVPGVEYGGEETAAQMDEIVATASAEAA